jgi:ElaB/YqjD/DUF883 family membrane-anchored ribosome-binding protein
MQNPVGTNKSPSSKPLQNVAEAMRDSARTTPDTVMREASNMKSSTEQSMSDISNKASRLANETAENAAEYYDKTSQWLQENYGKAISMIGFAAAVGTIGFLLGRNTRKSDESNFQSQSY